MSRVVVEDRFAEFGARFDEALKAGIRKTAEETRAVLPVTFPGTIGSSAKTGPVEPLPEKGWRGSAYLTDFRAVILDKGSLGKHVGKLKGGRRATWQVRRPSGTVTARRHQEALETGGIAPRRYTAQINRQIKPVFERNIAAELDLIT